MFKLLTLFKLRCRCNTECFVNPIECNKIPNKGRFMNEEQYLSRIRQLEEEIEYLHSLLDDAGISYELEVKG